MKAFLTIFALLLSLPALAGGVLDLSRPTDGKPVGILIAEPVDRFGVVAIATTGYGEVFLGHRFTVGPVNTTAYAGGEYLQGLGVKPRVRLVTSARREEFSLLSIVEAGGHTGNYNKLVIGYTPTDKLSISAVRLNGKNGGRVDFNLGVVNPYIEIVDHKVTTGLVVVF